MVKAQTSNLHKKFKIKSNAVETVLVQSLLRESASCIMN
jgi:stalled ribosome alternative rescue factor ArfA